MKKNQREVERENEENERGQRTKVAGVVVSLYECFQGPAVSVSTSLLLQVVNVKASHMVELVKVAGTCGKI